MAKLNVNPNRMELTKLKQRLTTAKRGHKLLKDKQDELMRRFIELVRKNDELRKSVEAELTAAYKNFALAGSTQPGVFLEEALMFPYESIAVEVESRNVMSVIVPQMRLIRAKEGDQSEMYPYGFFNTSAELDRAIKAIHDILPKLLELGEVEKTCNLMTDEIEKTRRRVNALEHKTIPQLAETIKYIKMKLDENERGNLTRLMKIKSMLAQAASSI